MRDEFTGALRDYDAEKEAKAKEKEEAEKKKGVRDHLKDRWKTPSEQEEEADAIYGSPVARAIYRTPQSVGATTVSDISTRTYATLRCEYFKNTRL